MRKLLAIILLLAATVPASTYAAVSFIASTTGADTSTFSTGSIDTTGANLLVVYIAYDTGGTFTVSDSKGNTWNALTAQNTGTNVAGRFYYSIPSSVGTSHSVTVTGSFFYGSARFMAFSGIDVADALEAQNGAQGSGTTIQPGSASATVNGSLFVTGIGVNGTGGTPYTVNNSFNELGDVAFSSGVYYGHDSAYLVQGTAGALNPTWTKASSEGHVSSIVVFNPAATPATSATSSMVRMNGGAININGGTVRMY